MTSSEARWCQTEKARPSGGELDSRSPHNLPNHLRCCWKTKIPLCFTRTMPEKLCFIIRGYQGKQHMKRAVFTGGTVCAMCRKRALILPKSSRFSLPQLFPTGRSAWPSQVRLGSAEKTNTPPLCHVSPYSPPPLMLATARTPPMCLTKMSLDTLRNSEDSLIFQQLPTSPKTLSSISN